MFSINILRLNEAIDNFFLSEYLVEMDIEGLKNAAFIEVQNQNNYAFLEQREKYSRSAISIAELLSDPVMAGAAYTELSQLADEKGDPEAEYKTEARRYSPTLTSSRSTRKAN